MMRHTLVLRRPPPLRVDARALSPAALCVLSREDVLRLALPHGRDAVPVAEWFDVRSDSSEDSEPALRLEGDCSRFDCIGAGLATGVVTVEGPVGDCAGLAMRGGELRVDGSARDLAACAMEGGLLEVQGDVGDFAAGALPGAMQGMVGGTVLVHGNAGARLADRMRRGTVVVHGDVGEFLASRLVAGTVAVGGHCGAHAGWGMRRGSVVFAGVAPPANHGFVPVAADTQVAWQLLARDLQRFGGRFEGLARRQPTRFVGDLSVDGQGEWLVPA